MDKSAHTFGVPISSLSFLCKISKLKSLLVSSPAWEFLWMLQGNWLYPNCKLLFPWACFALIADKTGWYLQDVFSSSVGLPSDSIPVSSGRGLQASQDAEVKRQEITGNV